MTSTTSVEIFSPVFLLGRKNVAVPGAEGAYSASSLGVCSDAQRGERHSLFIRMLACELSDDRGSGSG